MGPRSPLRFGRRRADIPRMSCAPSSARLRLLWGRCLWFKVSPPARSARGMRSPGPHSVSAPLRSLQNRRPPDVLQPIFRMASVVAWQAPHGSKVSAPLRSAQNRRPPDVLQHIFRTPSSALKWGKLNYTDFVQNCILDQKERTSL